MTTTTTPLEQRDAPVGVKDLEAEEEIRPYVGPYGHLPEIQIRLGDTPEHIRDLMEQYSPVLDGDFANAT